MYSFVWTDSDQSLFEYYSGGGTYLINRTERLLLANNYKRWHVYLKVKCVSSMKQNSVCFSSSTNPEVGHFIWDELFD